jgi:hypothetical protein
MTLTREQIKDFWLEIEDRGKNWLLGSDHSAGIVSNIDLWL